MNPLRAIAACSRKYALFLGRATRSEFWWWALLQGVVTSLLSLSSASTALNLWLLVTIAPTLAVSVRRLRDARMSWVLLLLAVVPVVNVALVYFFALPTAPVRVGESAEMSASPQ